VIDRRTPTYRFFIIEPPHDALTSCGCHEARWPHSGSTTYPRAVGGKYLAGGFNNATALSGASPANRIVLLQFESIDKAKAWYADGQAEREKKLGSKVASSFRILAIEGVNQ
jgi:uncharacterized protein (DUF1330 family)